jgi:hypothetical protein
MKLEHALSKVGVPQAAGALEPHWQESAASLGDRKPWFLEPAEVRVAREYGGFPPEAEAGLVDEAQRIASDPGTRLVAWHCHRLLYDHPDYDSFGRWPAGLGGTLGLLVAMGMVRRVREAHAGMGVPEEVTRETCSQLSCFAENYSRMTGGGLGIPVTQIYWTRHYPACRLFRLGRMEYMIHPFRGGVVAFRHRRSAAVVALAPDGTRYTDQGQVAWEAGGGWTARLERTAEAVTGSPVSPLGAAERRRVTLALKDWECVLAPGDATLDMHIPEGGRMTLEACGDSMRRAAAFFARFFPNDLCRTFGCWSWIFNTQFERIRLSSDNLVRFQRELYLFPVPSSGRDGLWFIFLQDQVDPAAVPRDTSLRRGVADFLATGERWRGGGMFFLVDDLPRFGTRAYRSAWPQPDVGPAVS